VCVSMVKARNSPITGAIAVAGVVMATPLSDRDAVLNQIFAACRQALERHKVPATNTSCRQSKLRDHARSRGFNREVPSNGHG